MVKSVDILLPCLNPIISPVYNVSGVGSNPTWGICETSQVLLSGVPGGSSRGSPVFAQPTDLPVSYEL